MNDDIIEEPSEDAQLPIMFNNAPQFDPDMTEADYVAAQEEYELQQLIASIEQEPDVQPHHYGSDDEDYDLIFMKCAMAEDGQSEQPSQTVQHGFGSEDMMDTDMMDL